MSISVVGNLLRALCEETQTWAVVMTRFHVVKTGEEQEETEETSAEASTGVAASTVDTTSPLILQYTTRGSFMVPNPHFVKK